ncbi:MAG: hypothetical protein U9O98_04655, partial [Asgard group archaeon]|nr:hypothetical protein [Asgard group archaeon]
KGHEDQILGLGGEKHEIAFEEEDIQCPKCERRYSIIHEIDLYSQNELGITLSCSKNHKKDFVVEISV